MRRVPRNISETVSDALNLCRWYVSQFDANNLPSLPFTLTPGIVVEGRKFYQSLYREAQSTIAHLEGKSPKPCPRESPLLIDLAALKEICETQRTIVFLEFEDDDIDF